MRFCRASNVMLITGIDQRSGRSYGRRGKPLRLFPVIGVMLVVATLRPAAQSAGSATILGDLLKEWTNMKETIANIGDAMPEDKFGFKPTPAQRTFGEQLLHIAFGNVLSLKSLRAKATPPAIDLKATSKAAILKAVADSYDYGTAVIKEQTEQSIAHAIEGPPVPELSDPAHGPIGTVTRAKIVWAAIGHAWDEYGVMTTYLRLNNIVPPASRR